MYKKKTKEKEKIEMKEKKSNPHNIIPTQNNHRLVELLLEPNLKKQIESIIRSYHNKHQLNKFGMTHENCICAIGGPGTGKTFTASVIATETKLPLYTYYMYTFNDDYKKFKTFLEDILKLDRGIYHLHGFYSNHAPKPYRYVGINNKNHINDIFSDVLKEFILNNKHYLESILFVECREDPYYGFDNRNLFHYFDTILNYTPPSCEIINAIITNKLSVLDNFEDDKISDIVSNFQKNQNRIVSHSEIVHMCDNIIRTAKTSVTDKWLNKKK